MGIEWTTERIQEAINALRSETPGGDGVRRAMRKLSERWGRTVNADQLRHALTSRNLSAPSQYLGTGAHESGLPTHPRPVAKPVADVRERVDADRVGELVRECRKGADFGELCDRLRVWPERLRELIADAQGRGYVVNVAGDHVGWHQEAPTDVRDIGVAPVVGGRSVVAAISDTHIGSKYCLSAELLDFIGYAYEKGVRHVLHAGDLLDGCYDHGRWELRHHGFDEQVQAAIDLLPRLDGLSYWVLMGNHDLTFGERSGHDVGADVESRFRTAGRQDLHTVGPRGAVLSLGGVKVELWHPKTTSAAYSLSYRLQNHIRDYGQGKKPDVLIAGHWHVFVHLEQRGVNAVAAPTFMGAGSAFSKSIGGSPALGGALLSWERTAHGTLRRFAVERSVYYEQEHVREVLV